MRTSVRPFAAWTTSETTTRATCNHLSMNAERALLSTCSFCLTPHWLKVWALSFVIHIHVRFSLSRFSSSTSTCPSLSFFFFFHFLHCELSTPPRGVTTPATSTPPSQVMSPTSWLSTSSTNFQVPSPALSRHRTRTWMTWHSASCSPKHTEDKPITANQKACQSVVVVFCVRWSRETFGRKKRRSINWFWCHEKHVQCSQQVFWKHPSWESGR